MNISTLILAFGIACVFVGWPIVGKKTGLSGEYVGVVASQGTLTSVVLLSVRRMLAVDTPAFLAVAVLFVVACANGAGVYFYSLKSTDKTIPTSDFVAVVCIFMVMLAPIQDYFLNEVSVTWKRVVGYGFAALTIYFLK